MSASARVKYGSAFSPVIPSKSIRNHPFSINNLLNLQDKRNENNADRDLTDTSTTASAPSNASPLEMPPREKQPNKAKATDSSPSTSNLTLNCSFWPPWVYATRYSRQGIPPANFSNPRRARKPIKRQKQRPLFSQEQLQKLEEEFVNEKYISKSRRCKLAMDINLTEAQVRTWFQNRRTRWRKEVHDDCEDDNSWAGSGLTSFGAGVFGANCMVVRGYCSS